MKVFYKHLLSSFLSFVDNSHFNYILYVYFIYVILLMELTFY